MTRLRDDYDPNAVPVDSSAIHKVDHQLLELKLSDDVPWEGVQETEAQTDYERRRGTRRTAPKTAMRIRVQRMLNAVVYRIYANRFYQVGFIAITVAAIALIWYSATFRIHLIDEMVTDFAVLGELQSELLAIKEVWSAEQMETIADSVENADKRRVFVDYRGLAVWLREKSVYAEQLGLGFSYTLGSGQASRIEDMLEVPIELTLTGAEGTQESSQTYLHVLEFMRRLVSTLYYVEIVEASLEGEGDGAKTVTALLRVWVHATVNVDGQPAE
ncbi:MAG: hypothetical protein AAFZ58_03100 [Pseudomonadota bacterium]